MIAVLKWWLIMEILTLAALPLAFRLFHRMPGRGYLMAKPLGLLLAGFVLWIGATFGPLNNTVGGIVVAIGVTAGLSVAAYRIWPGREGRERDSLIEFLRARWKYVLACELLFLVAFAGWALYRAFDPDLVGTEKPMEFAFLNSILRSEHFPPQDPWMAGYAISYYYFGYLLVAMVTKLSGVSAAFGFSLGIALLFALTVTGAFSVVFDLVAGTRKPGQGLRQRQSAAFGVLGAVFVALMGNLEGLLEALHSRGLLSAGFWKWINIHGLAEATVTGSFLPSDHWWWWRASRVIFDHTLTGQYSDVIDEFPFFSFILGDMHPHVLALPFVLLAIALIVNLVRTVSAIPPAEATAKPPALLRFWRWLTDRPVESVLVALCLGALGFLNTWDLPIYWVLATAAYLVATGVRSGKWDVKALWSSVAWGARILMFGLALFAPFWVGFQSQAGGIAPVILTKTRSEQYLVMFGFLIFLAVAYALHLLSRWRNGERGQPFRFTGDLRWIVPSALVVILVSVFLLRWLPVWLTLLIALLAIGLTRSLAAHAREGADPSRLSDAIVALFMVGGLLLTLVVEFVFLRDYFNSRMNTVFKFYYQGWVLLSIGGAYAAFALWSRMRTSSAGRAARSVFAVVLALGLAASLVYTVAAGYSKANRFAVRPTLNALSFSERYNPGEYAAIQWVNENISGMPVILEATGGSYTEFARVSERTGLPTLLGWDFHEQQWRGSRNPAGSRRDDVAIMYKRLGDRESLTLLDRYGISYVFVGGLERSTYGVTQAALDRFGKVAQLVYDKGDVRIYRYFPPQEPVDVSRPE